MVQFRRAAAILCAAILLLTFGCSSDPTHGKKPKPSEIVSKIQKDIKFPEMLSVKQERLSRYYSVSSGLLDDFSVSICSSAASSSEVAVFKGKTTADAVKIKDAVNKRLDQKKGVFENYGEPQEYSNLKNCVVDTKGPYVFFAVCGDSAKARSDFNSFFN
ncbi:MAG TPA: DUF4358 domain-containing protein [Clostridia bacterium]|nr:DUF4358 domain-containing protein [Clostridia bacterium]